MIELRPTSPSAHGFEDLVRESLTEGSRMVERLRANWKSGLNHFDKRGELLIGAFAEEALVAVCGRNIDPFADDDGIGRLRHLYVMASFRKQGVGKSLVRFLVSDAPQFFRAVNVRAPADVFSFYEHLGFSPVLENDTVTHRLYF